MLRHVASWGDRCPHRVHVAQCGEALSSRPVAIGALGGWGYAVAPVGPSRPIRKAKPPLYIPTRGLLDPRPERNGSRPMSMIFSKRGRAVFALAGVLALAMAGVADARPGGKSSGGGFGSRGSRALHAPAPAPPAPPPGAAPHRTLDGGADPAHPDDTRPDPAAASGRSGRAGPAAAQVRLRHRPDGRVARRRASRRPVRGRLPRRPRRSRLDVRPAAPGGADRRPDLPRGPLLPAPFRAAAGLRRRGRWL